MDATQTPQRTFQCPKCRHQQYETGTVYMTGGFWSKIFDIQGAKFTRLTCKQCGYTEFYQGDKKKLENVLDFLVQ